MYERLRSILLTRRVRRALDIRHPGVATHVVSLQPPRGYYTGAVRLPDAGDGVPKVLALRWWSPEMPVNRVADRIAQEIAPLLQQRSSSSVVQSPPRGAPSLIRREHA